MNTSTLTQNTELWKNILSVVSKETEGTVFDAFFRNTKIFDVNGNKVFVLCESKLTKEVLRDRFSDYLSQKLYQCTSSNYIPVFVTEDDVKGNKKFIESNEVELSYFKNSVLDPHYTFETFVVGPCNSEAQKASLYTATAPGGIYQTLFIYGGSGLGKTF